MKIGLMGNALRPLIQQGMIYGYDVAANELTDNLFRYSTAEKVTCMYEPGQFQQEILRRKLRKVLRSGNVQKEILMVSEYDLMIYSQAATELDVQVLHNVSSEFESLLSLREMLRLAAPITFTIHCASYPQLLSSFFLPMAMMPFKPYDTLICTSSAVRAAAQNLLERAEEYAGRKSPIRMDTIPLGVDTEKFCSGNRKELREKYGIPQEAFVILWLGRFSACDKADLYSLLLAISRLIQKNPDRKIRLILSGYQPQGTVYLDTLHQLAEEFGIGNEVCFQAQHEVSSRHELYAMSDVFTSPVDNLQETFGITPIEAMSCGVPQVVSDWDGYKDTVIDGVTGFRVPVHWSNCDFDLRRFGALPSDIEHRSQLHHYLLSQTVVVDLDAYEKAFQNLLDNEELLHNMSEASRLEAIRRYDWKAIVRCYDDLWQKLAEQAVAHQGNFEPNRLLLPNYCQDFAAYPTDMIPDSRKFCITPHGLQNLGHARPNVYGVEDLLFPPKLLQDILNASVQEPCSMESYSKTVKYVTPDQVRRTFMALYKYGMIAPFSDTDEDI